MHTVIETDSYLRDAKGAGMSEDERGEAANVISESPLGGAIMAETGGVRKVRLAGRGKGKSGGYRVIWWFGGDDIPVFLLSVFGKGEKDNLSKAECNALRRMTATLRESLTGKS